MTTDTTPTADDWLTRQAIRSLMDARLDDESPAQAYVAAYRRAWNDAIRFCIRAEQALERSDFAIGGPDRRPRQAGTERGRNGRSMR